MSCDLWNVLLPLIQSLPRADTIPVTLIRKNGWMYLGDNRAFINWGLSPITMVTRHILKDHAPVVSTIPMRHTRAPGSTSICIIAPNWMQF